MVYTTKELIQKGETQYSIRNKIAIGELFLVERGIYSDSKSEFVDEISICKKYPNAVLTGLSAFYIYDLTDTIPDKFYLATEQHSFPIRRNDVIQSYQESMFFFVGIIDYQYENGIIRIFDLERTLIELIRLKEKYPKELFYEVLNSFRRIKDKLDFYKINEYVKFFKYGSILLEVIKEVI